MTTDDLVPRILAVIDKLEAAALAVRDAPSGLEAITLPGRPQPSPLEMERLRRKLDRAERERLRERDPNKALLAEQSDWATVLRRCAAHRRIVETCRFWLHENDAGVDPCAEAVLRDLAADYGVAAEDLS